MRCVAEWVPAGRLLATTLLVATCAVDTNAAPATAWTWVNGSSTVDAPGVYGAQGTAAPSNVPGARNFPASWTDAKGNFWLFGGNGHDPTGYEDDLNDLWEYTPSTAAGVPGTWTWVSGANVADQSGVYGTQGTASPGNVPGARDGPVSWADAKGNFWLFGGTGYDSTGTWTALNDLWEYTPSATAGAPGTWIWVSGSNLAEQLGVYGTQGTASASNVPGARWNAASWKDAQGNLWLFGGEGGGGGDLGHLNDLWEYTPSAVAGAPGTWTWVSGSQALSPPGVYGTQGTASTSNVPGGRWGAASWTDAKGHFWLLGGVGYDSTGTTEGTLNDLWEYTPSATAGALGTWTWVRGSNLADQPGVYGIQGTASPSNVPGARWGAVSWTDAKGNFWLFGGYGYDSTGVNSPLNDLWEYTPSAVAGGPGAWTWVSGSNVADQSGVYGTQGTAAAGNVPGAREGAVSWTDAKGNFWLFGGDGYDSTGNQDLLNDLWEFASTGGSASANCSTNPPLNFPIFCLRPVICGPRCDQPFVYFRPPPDNFGDPWIAGTAVHISTATVAQSQSLAADLQVAVSSAPIGQQSSGRSARAELSEGHGRLGLHRVVVAGPTVDISARAPAEGVLQRATGLTRPPIFEVSVPYNAAAVARGARLRLVQYDPRKGRWLDVGAQSIDVAKHIVSARVAGVGRFTVVAEAPPALH